MVDHEAWWDQAFGLQSMMHGADSSLENSVKPSSICNKSESEPLQHASIRQYRLCPRAIAAEIP
jgi:hypothetical protein